MPFSTDVTVPRDLKVKFPKCCIGCDEPNEGATWSFSRRTSNWIGLFSIWIGRKYTIDVPCCADCRVQLRRQRWIRDWYLWIATIAALMVIFPRLEGMDRNLRKLVAVGALLVILAPSAIYAMMRPPKFDVHVRRKDVDLEFADPDYAESVYELNEDDGAEIED